MRSDRYDQDDTITLSVHGDRRDFLSFYRRIQTKIRFSMAKQTLKHIGYMFSNTGVVVLLI